MTGRGRRSCSIAVSLVLLLGLCACDDWQRTRIGDADGFGWGTGQGLAALGIDSASLRPGSSTEYYPVNVDGVNILGPGDFLPDMDDAVDPGDGLKHVWWTSETGLLPGDDWDNRAAAELAGDFMTVTGESDFAPEDYLITPGVDFNSEFTDLTLSRSYEASAGVEPARFGPFPKPPSDPHPGESSPSPDVDNQPNRRASPTGECIHCFVFDFRVSKSALSQTQALYLNLVFADYEVGQAMVQLETRDGTLFPVQLQKQSANMDGLIQAAWVILTDQMSFTDIFASDGDWWHCLLKVEFLDALNGQAGEPFTAFDFVEIATDQRSIGVVVVDPTAGVGQFTTIQAAIDDAGTGRGTIILVNPGTYNENINLQGKDVTLTSRDPGNPAATVIHGNGTTSVVTFLGTETQMCTVRGFTIENGNAAEGGGVNGNGSPAGIEYCVVRNNLGTNGAGLANCGGRVANNDIRGNSATMFGGGLYQCANLQANRIFQNTAALGGAGIADCAAATNNLVYRNVVTAMLPNNASGIQCFIPTTLLHNTVANNGGASASVVLPTSGAVFTNNIVWGSSADWGKLSAKASYCLIEGAPDYAQRESNDYNFGNEPLFLDDWADNYQLSTSSLAVDAGAAAGVATDFAGAVRPQGAAVDIGAYEQ